MHDSGDSLPPNRTVRGRVQGGVSAHPSRSGTRELSGPGGYVAQPPDRLVKGDSVCSAGHERPSRARDNKNRHVPYHEGVGPFGDGRADGDPPGERGGDRWTRSTLGWGGCTLPDYGRSPKGTRIGVLCSSMPEVAEIGNPRSTFVRFWRGCVPAFQHHPVPAMRIPQSEIRNWMSLPAFEQCSELVTLVESDFRW